VYSDQGWATFSPESLSLVRPSPTVIDTFVLFDPVTGTFFGRPRGGNGSSDVDDPRVVPPPTTTDTPPTSTYTPPTSTYTPPTSTYTPPTSTYTPPTSTYTPPTSSYTPPTTTYRHPTTQTRPS